MPDADFNFRMDRLTERHEALTQSLELLLADSREYTKQIDKHSEQLKQDAEHIRAVVRIAELHHERLRRLEGV